MNWFHLMIIVKAGAGARPGGAGVAAGGSIICIVLIRATVVYQVNINLFLYFGLILTILSELFLCENIINVDILIVNQHGDDATNVTVGRFLY